MRTPNSNSAILAVRYLGNVLIKDEAEWGCDEE